MAHEHGHAGEPRGKHPGEQRERQPVALRLIAQAAAKLYWRCSRMGRCTRAANTPSATLSHHTMS